MCPPCAARAQEIGSALGLQIPVRHLPGALELATPDLDRCPKCGGLGLRGRACSACGARAVPPVPEHIEPALERCRQLMDQMKAHWAMLSNERGTWFISPEGLLSFTSPSASAAQLLLNRCVAEFIELNRQVGVAVRAMKEQELKTKVGDH